MADPVNKYLITGATGQLGMALTKVFGGIDGPENNATARSHEALDITNTEHLATWLPVLRPDAVINCAAYTDVKKSETERELCWRTNVMAVDALAEICAKMKVPLVHISTDFVFGRDTARRFNLDVDRAKTDPKEWKAEVRATLYTETDPVGPVGYYAHTKALAEQCILQRAIETPEFQYYIIRTAGLFETFTRKKTNFPSIMAMLMKSRATSRVPVVSDVFTNITYAPHLAEAIKWIVMNQEHIPKGIYNITSMGITTWYAVAKRIASAMHRLKKLNKTTRDAFAKLQGRDPTLSPLFTCLNMAKYEETLGPIMPSWEDGIDDWLKGAIAFYAKN